MARIAVFLDHDIVIRHFLANGVLQPLQDVHDVTFVFPEGHRRVRTDVANLGLKNVQLFKVDESRAYLWRRLYQHDVLRRARGGSAANKPQIYAFWREMLGWKAFWPTWLMSMPGLYGIYRRRALAAIGRSKPFEHLMSELRPDVIVHPTVLEGLFVSDLIQWGREHGVPTVFLMNSWDNPAVKAMTVGQPDWLVVWGEQTKLLAQQHLGIPLERTKAFGSAQFDLYRHPPRQSRTQFLAECGIPASRKVVLYAGSSKGVKEVQHLVSLEEAIERGDLSDCHILFRPHPWRGTIAGELDFFSRAWRHVSIDPQMADYYRKSLDNPSLVHTPDTSYTHTLLSACDVLISPVSTILLEAVMHGKPVLAYLPDEDIDRNFFLRTMANMTFMQEFFDRTSCGPIGNMSELVERARTLLLRARDPDEAMRIRRTAEYFVAPRAEGYLGALRALIAEIVNQPRSRATASASD